MIGGTSINKCTDSSLILFNTKIYTLNDTYTLAEALVIKDKKIVYVGDNEGVKEYECGDYKKIDLAGSYIFPGFTDSHAHLKGIGYRENTLNLQGINSLEETLISVKEYSDQRGPDQWIIGRGWIEKLWPEKRFPSRKDLDTFSNDKPVLLERADGHAVLVNSFALRLAGIDSKTEDPHGGALHTSSAVKTIDRIIDVFPAGQKSQIRSMLSESIIAVIAQKLLPIKSTEED